MEVVVTQVQVRYQFEIIQETKLLRHVFETTFGIIKSYASRAKQYYRCEWYKTSLDARELSESTVDPESTEEEFIVRSSKTHFAVKSKQNTHEHFPYIPVR